jgi:hypothetical protein
VVVVRNVEKNTTIAPDPEKIAIVGNDFFMLETTNVDRAEKNFKLNSMRLKCLKD